MKVEIELTHESTRVTVTLGYYGSPEVKRIAWGLFSVRSLPGVYLGSAPCQVILHVGDRSAETLADVYRRASEVQRVWLVVVDEVERHAELHRLSDEVRTAALIDQVALVAGSN